MKTRAQTDSQQAYDNIEGISQPPNTAGIDSKAYGSLCHHFPMLVLRSGLCQAVAFYGVKAHGQTNPHAYRAFLQHIASACGHGDQDYTAFQKAILAMELPEYQRVTRRILAAAIWYKRFAVRVLDVDGTENE